MTNFEYIRTASIKGALDAFSRTPNSSFIAGGTNLIDLMKRGVTSPQRLIDINSLPLKSIEANNSGVRIGALAINSEVAIDKNINQNYPLLALALKAGASAQLRNMATVGGNMMQRTRCSYFYDTTFPCNKRQPGTGCSALKGYNRMHAIFGGNEKCIAVHPSDMCVALAALDARIEFSGPDGDRTLPFTDFHRLPGETPERDNNLKKGELIRTIFIPANPFTKNVSYLKIRDRASYAFALVSVAAALDMNGNKIKQARLAMGGVAHKPWRLTEVEKFLAGKEFNSETIRNAGTLAIKGAKGYGFNDFKIKLTSSTVMQALVNAHEGKG
jgi:xanthine dehydrogenase YagS FAD-binding subunit